MTCYDGGSVASTNVMGGNKPNFELIHLRKKDDEIASANIPAGEGGFQGVHSPEFDAITDKQPGGIFT